MDAAGWSGCVAVTERYLRRELIRCETAAQIQKTAARIDSTQSGIVAGGEAKNEFRRPFGSRDPESLPIAGDVSRIRNCGRKGAIVDRRSGGPAMYISSLRPAASSGRVRGFN